MRASAQAAVAYGIVAWRSGYRSVRYWLPIMVATTASLLLFLFYAGLYDQGAGYLPVAEVLSPRRFLALHGAVILALFLATLVFFALDEVVPGRSGAIEDVLCTKPSSNFWCLSGRVVALATMAWLPLLATVGLIRALSCGKDPKVWLTCGIGTDAAQFAVFVLLDALPLLLLWSAVLVFLGAMQRSRIIVALSSLVVLGAFVWAVLSMPTHLRTLLRPASELGEYLSETLPAMPALGVIVQRAASTMLALGVVSLAALLLPRHDDHRRATAFAGIAFVVFAVVGILITVTGAHRDLERRSLWRAAHTAVAQEFSAIVDIEHLAGVVRISPNEELHIDVDMRLRRTTNDPMTKLVFSLNPGMEIVELRVGESHAQHAHELGVLSVLVPDDLREASALTISVGARGIPDPDFAYLDSALDWRQETGAGLAFMGTEATLFDSGYVALMPAARWLPGVGPNVIWDDWSRDFFAVDLLVETPPNWLPAGPGYRTTVSEGKYRFRPESPVGDVAIIASAFERFATRTGGVQLELLIDAKHLADIEPFVDAMPLIVERFKGLLDDARSLGLPYPYGALSFVDVPSRLRVYGGGWRMGTLQSMPGILLVRENHFQAARARRSMIQDKDAVTKFQLLANYWHNDATGGNPIRGLTRNLLAFQTSAHREGAAALDFLLEELTSRLLADGASDFSVHSLQEAAKLTTLIDRIYAANTASGLTSGLAALEPSQFHPSVWDRALEGPLVELDVHRNPREALEVLRLKCRSMADVLGDVLGRRTTAEILADLRRRHSGDVFAADNLVAAIAEADQSLGSDLRAWLYDANLPGFVASEPEVFRLPDDDRGRPRHQILIHIRNNENTPGWMDFQFGRAYGMTTVMYDAEPARVDGLSSVEVGLVSRVEPTHLFVRPYLALNRRSIYVDLDDGMDRLQPPLEAFSGTRPSAWQPPEAEGLIVDDLDAGFSTWGAHVNLSGRHSDIGPRLGSEYADRGLPAYRPPPLVRHSATWAYGRLFQWIAHSDIGSLADSTVEALGRGRVDRRVGQWYRQEMSSAWGEYRRTAARTPAGNGDAEAVFTAEIPVSGHWRLYYHLPDIAVVEPVIAHGAELVVGMSPKSVEVLGSYDLRLVSASGETPLHLDRMIGPSGWIPVGEFALEEGKVHVVVSNRTTARTVVADAIRWNLMAEPTVENSRESSFDSVRRNMRRTGTAPN